jgi:hypothetical protein
VIVSGSPRSASRGGDLDWLNPGDTVPDFEREMDALKPGEVAKPAEAAVAPQPAELPKIDYFADAKFPETIKVTDEQRGELAGAFDALRTPGKHAEGVQKLISLHEKALTDYAKQVVDNQWATFRKTNEDWANEVMGDPYLGGAGHKTAMAAVARMRDLFMSTHKPGTPEYERDAKSFDQFLQVTGAGNHPAFLHLLHNAARIYDEPAVPAHVGAPTKTHGQAPGRKSLRDIYAEGPRKQ